jgi:sulfite exporter TauE/SafE
MIIHDTETDEHINFIIDEWIRLREKEKQLKKLKVKIWWGVFLFGVSIGFLLCGIVNEIL